MRFLVSVKSFIVPHAKSDKFFLVASDFGSVENRRTRQETSGIQGKKNVTKVLNKEALLSHN